MKIWMTLASLAFLAQMSWAQNKDVVNYKIDASHTSIVFKVSHLGFSNTYGMFPGAEGKIALDNAKPEQSTFEVKVKTADLNTFDKKRDEHLRGPDFFNVKQFPAITLKSKSIKKKSDSEYDITADLSMHGVTKPVNFTFKRFRTGRDPWGNTRTGGETTFKVKRSDFGMTYMNGPDQVGDEVELMISLEGIQQ